MVIDFINLKSVHQGSKDTGPVFPKLNSLKEILGSSLT